MIIKEYPGHRQSNSRKPLETTISVGDFTYVRHGSNIYRWPSDTGKFGNGEPERVESGDIPESVKAALMPG